jgi:serine/threonine protein kinase/WD40 repeat protein
MNENCPPTEKLDQFLREELTEAEETALQAHVNNCQVCLARLGELYDAEVPPLPVGAAGVLPWIDFKPGEQLPIGVEVLKYLGEGGMGRLYRVYHGGLDKELVLKVIRPSLYANLSPQTLENMLQRFKQEAQVASSLDESRHFARVYDAGQFEHAGLSGKPQRIAYYTMGLVDGPGLHEMLERGPLSPEKAVSYLKGIVRGLVHAHGKGILHRDLKPSNIMIDKSDSPILIDWGLAKFLRRDPAEQATGAHGGSLGVAGGAARPVTVGVMGTPAYMAPEQGEDSSKATVRSDIYSAGAVFFTMLTGRPPRPVANTEQWTQVLKQPLPAWADMYCEKISVAIRDICERCLAKEPTMRFKSAAVLLSELEALPVSALEPESIDFRANINRAVAGALGACFGGLAACALARGSVISPASVIISGMSNGAAGAVILQLIPAAGWQRRVIAGSEGSRLWASLLIFLGALGGCTAASLITIDNALWSPLVLLAAALGAVLGASENPVIAPLASVCVVLSLLVGAVWGLLGFWLGGMTGFLLVTSICGGGCICYVAFEVENVAFGLLDHYPASSWEKLVKNGNERGARLGWLVARLGLPLAGLCWWWMVYGDESLRLDARSGVTSISVFAEGRQLCSLSRGQYVGFWQIGTGKSLCFLDVEDGEAITQAVSQDGQLVLVGGGGQKPLQLLGLKTVPPGVDSLCSTYFLLDEEEDAQRSVLAVALSPDGVHAVSAGPDGIVRLWNVANRAFVRKVGQHGDWQLSPRGREIERHPKTVHALAFSPDGRFVHSGGGNCLRKYRELVLNDGHPVADACILRLWDVTTGRMVKEFEGHKAPINCVAFSPDGRFALSGSGDFEEDPLKRVTPKNAIDCTVRLWDTATGKEFGRFEGHETPVRSVAFSTDGRRILSCSGDKSYSRWRIKGDCTVRLWDVETRKELRRFTAHDDRVNCVAFTSEGRQAVSGSDDGTIRFWRLPP